MLFSLPGASYQRQLGCGMVCRMPLWSLLISRYLKRVQIHPFCLLKEPNFLCIGMNKSSIVISTVCKEEGNVLYSFPHIWSLYLFFFILLFFADWIPSGALWMHSLLTFSMRGYSSRFKERKKQENLQIGLSVQNAWKNR